MCAAKIRAVASLSRTKRFRGNAKTVSPPKMSSRVTTASLPSLEHVVLDVLPDEKVRRISDHHALGKVTSNPRGVPVVLVAGVRIKRVDGAADTWAELPD